MAAHETAYPEFATQAPITSPNSFKVHVAIDFGTDGVALAYTFGAADQVTAHAEWSGRKYQPKFKPKTIILLDENYKKVAFGKDAKHTYMTAESMKDKWMLFERFKMALYNDDNINPDMCEDNDDEKKHNNNNNENKPSSD